MNDEHAHLTTTGDEITEARIIAWVLGEASPFEASELEALCEQMPEWLVFQRRMLALHDCLKEVHAPVAEDDWKLSAEKRGRFDELLGKRETVEDVRRKPRRKWWVNAAGIAAFLMLGFVLYQGATTTMGKVSHEVVMQNRELPNAATYSAEKATMDSASNVVAGSIVAEQSETLREKFMLDDTRSAPPEPSSSSAPTMAAVSSSPTAVAITAAGGKDSSVVFGNGDEMGEGWGGRAGVAEGVDQQDLSPHVTGYIRSPDRDKASNESEGRADSNLQSGQMSADRDRLAAAEKAQEQVLRENSNDQSVRGLGNVAEAKGIKSDADYDQTRASLLTEVDKSWRREAEKKAQQEADGRTSLTGKTESVAAGSHLSIVADPKAKMARQDDLAQERIDGLADSSLRGLEKTMESQLELKPSMKPKVPAETRMKPERWTADEPYSTFSLRVSDNSFRIAQAAMAQNQRPAADSVRVEEFYNAFDYGDPIPTAQEPVTASMEQSAHPVLPQRHLLRIALRTASHGRSAGQPLSLTLLIDQSGSMNRADRRAALLASVQELSQMLQEEDQISVIGFSRTPRLLAEKIPGNQTQRLLEIVRTVPSDGGTNLEEALKLGEVVAKRNQLPNAQNRLLLVTDGAANLGNADPARLSEWVKQLRQKNLSFDIAGIGTDGLNDPLLVEIARHGNGRYYVMNDAAQATQQFTNQLAGAFRPVAENVKVQVQFNPQRVSRYQLIGFEKDRLRTEDFRNDKVDAAEMAAAEAGQALYQIELLPEGVGEIGEVSVRFRDVATQQMVERKWTIRHNATTLVFDRATPTMQLAGLAMLSAQKLQGGDFAPMIRFSEMQEPRRRVRDAFSQSQRVGELLQMIDQLQD